MNAEEKAIFKKQNMETYGQTVKKYRLKKGLSAEALADLLDVTKGTIRNWECGLARPDVDYVRKMCSIFDIEPNDFFGMEGVGSLLSTEENNLISFYRSLDKRGRHELLRYAEVASNEIYLEKKETVLADFVERNGCNLPAAAGTIGEEWDEHIEKTTFLFRANDLVKRTDDVFHINGHSMEPMYLHGDQVLVEYCDDLRPGEVGIFNVSGVGAVVKLLLNDGTLHSINPEYGDVIPREGARLIGRVLGKVTEDMLPTKEQEKLYWEAIEEKRARLF